MRLTYDKPRDVLYITFKRPKRVTCIEGRGNVVMRLDADSETVVGFTILQFSTVSSKSGTISWPYVTDRLAGSRLSELVRVSKPELERSGHKSFHFNPRVPFTNRIRKALR